MSTSLETAPKPMMSAAEGAAYLGIGRATFYNLIAAGSVPVRRIAGVRKTWVRRDDLDRLIAVSETHNGRPDGE